MWEWRCRQAQVQAGRCAPVAMLIGKHTRQRARMHARALLEGNSRPRKTRDRIRIREGRLAQLQREARAQRALMRKVERAPPAELPPAELAHGRPRQAVQ